MIEERPDRSTEVVLAGRSNVGKSTLMRELTGHTFDTGRRPGVTQAANHFDWAGPDLVLTDLPGFGFMEGVPEERREEIKTSIVRYLEAFAEEIELAVLVLDGNSAVEIMERHTGPDSIPHDVELYGLLQELGIPTVVAVNKIDKVDDRDDRLNAICEHLGLHPPWQQWQDRIAPISAKRGSIESLREAAEQQLRERGRDDVLQVFS